MQNKLFLIHILLSFIVLSTACTTNRKFGVSGSSLHITGLEDAYVNDFQTSDEGSQAEALPIKYSTYNAEGVRPGVYFGSNPLGNLSWDLFLTGSIRLQSGYFSLMTMGTFGYSINGTFDDLEVG